MQKRDARNGHATARNQQNALQRTNSRRKTGRRGTARAPLDKKPVPCYISGTDEVPKKLVVSEKHAKKTRGVEPGRTGRTLDKVLEVCYIVGVGKQCCLTIEGQRDSSRKCETTVSLAHSVRANRQSIWSELYEIRQDRESDHDKASSVG